MQNIIYNDNCFNKFKDIAKRSVDLILVDLPYNCLKIDWECDFDLKTMWIHLRRILKLNGQALFFCTTKFGCKLINSNPTWYAYDMIFEKNKATGHLFSNRALLRKHEMIYLFYRKGKPKNTPLTYNPQMSDGEPYSNGLIQNKNTKVYTTNKEIIHQNLTGERFPHSIIKIGNTANNQNKLHPTQKPVDLCEWLIKTYSNEGDVVMDFTMGSGSTIIACINTNRKYIGIEKDADYFKIAEKRINETLQNI